jgi:mannitol/fructose-specific phosphotransferase system IIA component (Ntr-type)
MGPTAIAAGIGIAVPGVVLYLMYGSSRTYRLGVLGLRGRRTELLKPPTAEIQAVAAPIFEDAKVIVALFGSERTPELLVEHAAALAEGECVEVVLLSELPEQIALDAVRADPKIESIERRVKAVAEAEKIDLTFHAIATRDVVRTVYELTNRVNCDWLVMNWAGRSRHSFTITNPLGWLKSHIACNLAVYHDAGVRYFRKILVHAEPGPHDALVAATADRLAVVHDASLSFVRYLPDEASEEQERDEREYAKQMAALCDTDADVLIVRGKSEAAAIGKATASFDLLVTTEPYETLLGQLLARRENELTDAAACSVLRLQTPRSETHQAVQKTHTKQEVDLLHLLEPSCVVARIAPLKKDALFEYFAKTFAEALPSLDEDTIEAALHERERSQNTAVGHGVALPHATVPSAERTYLGIFTARERVDYLAPDGEGIDVFFVTIGPPSERNTHLLLLAKVSRLALQTSLLQRLRSGESASELRRALEECLGELEQSAQSQGAPSSTRPVEA